MPEKIPNVSASRLFAVDGALVVVDGLRVGRLDAGEVTWLGTVPKRRPDEGPQHVIRGAYGTWPQSLGVGYWTQSGCIGSGWNTYWPIVGKERPAIIGLGGYSVLANVVRVGETTALVRLGPSRGLGFIPLRGPTMRHRPMLASKVGCKIDNLPTDGLFGPVAVEPNALEISRAGTMVSIGNHCAKDTPTAEVWDQTGVSRLVSLHPFWTRSRWGTRLLKGEGDELFAFTDAFEPILRYHDGVVEQLPDLGRVIEQVFVSFEGKLHASDGNTVHKWEGGRWIAVGELVDTPHDATLAMDRDVLWGQWPKEGNGSIYRYQRGLQPTGRRGPSGTGVATQADCPSPFVYLYDVFYGNSKRYSYPTTRKALSSFDERSGVRLVEFEKGGVRRLGVQVSSRAEGEAVIAQVIANMPGERPKFLCYSPPNPRIISPGSEPTQPKPAPVAGGCGG